MRAVCAYQGANGNPHRGYTPAMAVPPRSRAPRQQLPPGVQRGMFDGGERRPSLPSTAPLAARMRPVSLDEFQGQLEVVGPDAPLRRMIDGDLLTSIILWGPPGAGKTTLANIVATQTRRYFAELSAVSSGVADVRRLIAEARDRKRISGRHTILFIDELHRFNRAQQDALLPDIENGTVTLIGRHHRKPVVLRGEPAALSRSRVFRLELLDPEDIIAIVTRALADPERGLGLLDISIDPAALSSIPQLAAGDARTALNLVEMAAGISQSGTSDGAQAAGSRRGPCRLGSWLHNHQGDDRACGTTPDDALRPPGRCPLRHDLGLHQDGARLRSGRCALLARAHARSRRGSALRRPPTRRIGRRRCRTGRSGRIAAGGRLSAGDALPRDARGAAPPGRDDNLPRAGSQVELGLRPPIRGRLPTPSAPATRLSHWRSATLPPS